MSIKRRLLSIARHAAYFAAFGAIATLAASAQQGTGSTASTTSLLSFPLYLASTEVAVGGLNYSSSLDEPETAAAERFFNSDRETQQPPRRYGRPVYHDSHTNADGSNKYTFIAGAGFTQPIGNTFHYLDPSYGIQLGGGRNFNKKLSLLLQFDWDNFGFTGANLYNQSVVEDPANAFGIRGQLNGTSHIWSFSLDPTFNILEGDSMGAYVVAGTGFYHKTANFTVPVTTNGCEYYFGIPVCGTFTANETIDKYTSNAPGFSGGFGVTYKFSRFSGERFYAEVRYVFVDNSQRAGFNINNYTAETATSTNLYPANSNRTTYIPVKVGIRF